MQSTEPPKLLLPLTCRCVASDQWLAAHFDSAWKISQVKQYILTKVTSEDSAEEDYSPSRRPVSPITFASVFPSRYSFDRATDTSLEDDPEYDSDTDVFPMDNPKQARGKAPAVVSYNSPVTATNEAPTAVVPTNHYSLIFFSTGEILEDDYTLSWYHLHPHELLELHPPGTIVRLPREIMLEYIQPYFEVKVKALRVIVSEKDVLPARDNKDPKVGKIKKMRDAGEPRSPGDKPAASIRKRKKTKLEWRDRWLIIHHGMLNLYKSKSDTTPVHSCSVSSLSTLRGADDVVHAAGSASSPYVVCAKFHVSPTANNVESSQLNKDPAASPVSDVWVDPWSGATIPTETEEPIGPAGGVRPRPGSKEDILKARRSTADSEWPRNGGPLKDETRRDGEIKAETFWHDLNLGDGSEGTWVILDMLEEHAQSNLLRVLHRFAPETVKSTFVPSHLLPSTASPLQSSSASSNTQSSHQPPYPFPEWRMDAAKRAHRSGLGNISKPLSWIMWGGSDAEVSSTTTPSTRARASSMSTTLDRVNDSDEVLGHFEYESDTYADVDDGSDCEKEWDGWMKDLVRQTRTNKHVAVTVTEPPIPPSLVSDADVSRNRRNHVEGMVSSVSSPGVSSSESSIRQSRHHELGTMPQLFKEDVPPDAHFPYSATQNRAYTIFSDIPGGLEALSARSPALLTTPSIMPLPATGVTTSTVSVGGVIRARSLTAANEDGRGRGVPRAMEVVKEVDVERLKSGKPRSGKTRREDERSRVLSTPTSSSFAAMSPTSTMMSVMTTDDTSTVQHSPGSSSKSAKNMPTRTVPLPSISAAESSIVSVVEVEKEGGKEKKSRLAKGFARSKTFSPERLVKGLDSALDFVDGRK